MYIAAPPLGDKLIDAVVPDDISKALARVAPLSESTYRGVVMLLRRIFGTARRNHLISDDPTDGISSKGGRPATEKTALTNEEVGILLDSVKGLRIETFILLGLYAGLRREEILGLQWDCVFLDGEHPYIQIRRAWRIANNRPIVSEELKTPAARRDIPIPPILADHLRAKKSLQLVIMSSQTARELLFRAHSGEICGSRFPYAVQRSAHIPDISMVKKLPMSCPPSWGNMPYIILM